MRRKRVHHTNFFTAVHFKTGRLELIVILYTTRRIRVCSMNFIAAVHLKMQLLEWVAIKFSPHFSPEGASVFPTASALLAAGTTSVKYKH